MDDPQVSPPDASFVVEVERHRERLLGTLCRRIGRTRQGVPDPEEVLDDALVAASRKWNRHRAASTGMSSYAFLYRAAQDALIEAWRRLRAQRRDPEREVPWPEQSSVQLALHLADSGTSPSRACDRKELAVRMRLALEALKPRDREIITMRHDDELTHAEIAEVLGTSENAATVAYARALLQLRAIWRRMNQDRAVPS